MRVQQEYHIVKGEGFRGKWRARISAWHYTLLDGDHELLVYHWHPKIEGVAEPHLHANLHDRCSPALTANSHVPTGRIALEQFIRMLIDECEVEPIRNDWPAVLDSGQTHFEKHRTWPMPG